MNGTSSSSSAGDSNRFDPFCLMLGWMLPGLGYFRIRQPRRGSLVMAGILAMFLVGVLVGGVDVVDRRNSFLWFLPQAMIGPPAFVADYLNERFVKTGTIGTRSLNRVNDVGTLFVALGGLMNLATMIDSATRDPAAAMERRKAGGGRPS